MNFKGTKFVHIDWHTDYDKYILSTCQNNLPNVFLNNPPDKRAHTLLWFLYKIHMSDKSNAFFKLPFKRLWNPCFLEKRIRKNLSKDDKIVFLFSDSTYKYNDNNLIAYFKKKYPHCCTAYVLPDKVTLYQLNDKNFSIEQLKKIFDFVLSYNDLDVQKYDLIKEPLKPLTFYEIEDDEKIDASDVFFVGREKGRLDDILHVYKIAKQMNLKCDFTILDVPEDKRLYSEDIEYDKRLSYIQMLKRAKRSKAILNIMQSGSDGITLRDYEAIGMNKILITNSTAVKSLPAFNDEMVVNFKNLENELSKIVHYDSTISWKENNITSCNDYYSKLQEILRTDS